MAKKSKVQIDPEPKPDLTPMIDIVFNLIIFFMIVSDLSNLEVEQLTLPFADRAEKPPPSTGNQKVLQINVLEDGLIKVRGKAFTMDPALKDQYAWLADYLAIEAAGFEREPWDQPGVAPSTMRVNIRADRDSQFKYVQHVFDACCSDDVKIYKTSLAATKDPPTQ